MKWICAVSSSGDVRRSRGKFDPIQWLIKRNPASIRSWLSLNAGESWWTHIRLIPSWIEQKLRKEEKYIDFYKENSSSDVSRPFHDVICIVWSHEAIGIVAHDAVHVLLKWEPSNEDRRLIMCPRVPQDRKYWIFSNLTIVSHDVTIVSHDCVIIRFPQSDRHRRVEVSPRVATKSHDRAISSQASDLHLTWSTVCIFACAADDDWENFGPLDRCTSCRRYRIQRSWCHHVVCKGDFRGNIVLHGRKEGNKRV